MRTVVVSGGFDPLHPGHVALFRQARALGDKLVVVVESDEWVARKHPVQQKQGDRAELVAAMEGVDSVLLNHRPDGDCSALVLAAGAAVFVVGRDHQDVSVIPEYRTLTEAGVVIAPVYTSRGAYRSSRIVEAAAPPAWVNPIPMVAAAITRWVGRGRSELLVAVRRDTGLLELPGGFVEVGETLEEAAAREVEEELGRKVSFASGGYVGTWSGSYRDGRAVLVAGLAAYLDAAGSGTIAGGFMPTPEVTAVGWHEHRPAGEWDNQADLAVANKVMGWD